MKSLPGGWTSVSVAVFLIAAGTAVALNDNAVHAIAVDIERGLLGGALVRETAPAREHGSPTVVPPTPIRPDVCGTGKWHAFIAEAARRFDVLERWLDALVRAESAGCVLTDGRPTTSPAGAMGLMQLMPKTWETYRDRLALGNDPHDPRDNILAGAAFLRDLYDRFGWPGAAAAYHAGPARYSEYLSTGRALPSATREYLARIDRILGAQQHPAQNFDRAPLKSPAADSRTSSPMAPPPTVALDVEPTVDPAAASAPRENLFVPLRHGERPSQIEPRAPADVQNK